MEKQKITYCIIAILFTVLYSGSRLNISFAQKQVASQSPGKFDEFGDINCEDELARLDNFSVQLQSDPNLQGYIIIYGGRRGRRNEAKARAARMKHYLVYNRGLDKRRVITLDGGFRENLMGELWLFKVNEPAPSPTPTVDPKDVKLRGRVRVKGYFCGEGVGV
jgi:hypothetical protein